MANIYSAENIRNFFPSAYYARGRSYFQEGRVRELKFSEDGRLLKGKVEGNLPNPYRVKVEINKEGAKYVEFFGECSCPIGYNCKHVVALLLAGLAAPASEDTEKKPVKVEEKVTDYFVIEWLRKIEEAVLSPSVNNYSAASKQRLLYLLDLKKESSGYRLIVSPAAGTVKKDGSFNSWKYYDPQNAIKSNPAQFLLPNDVIILRRLAASVSYNYQTLHEYTLSGKEGAQLFEDILASGRCYWQKPGRPNLTVESERSGKIRWETNPDGTQQVACDIDGAPDFVLPLVPPYYLNLTQNCCGKLNLGIPAGLAGALLQAPPLNPLEITAVEKKLSTWLKDTPVALPKVFDAKEEKKITPVPHLWLCNTLLKERVGWWWTQGKATKIPIARLSFIYGRTKIGYSDQSPCLTSVDNNKLIAFERNQSFEKSTAKKLNEYHLAAFQKLASAYVITNEQADDYFMEDYQGGWADEDSIINHWLDFNMKTLPKLRNQGWQIEIAPDFAYNLVEPDDEWYAEVDDSGGIDWFGVELGIMVGGERLNLLPILLTSLKENPDIFEQLQKYPQGGKILCPLKNGSKLLLPVERIKTIFGFLKDLYNFENLDQDGKIKLSRLEAADLAEFEAAMEAAHLRWFGGQRVKQLGEKLRNFAGIAPVKAPGDFKAELRPYQQEGLNWLQFLREYELAGILADDMGLGKTIQALAHVTLEKEQNRLNKPALVIAPTSVMTNWQMELQRFAPDLKVLTLHGMERKAHYDKIKDHDLILTTYPLLIRDKDELMKETYHTVILDEAQYIKNTKAKMTQVVNQLKADNRLCLTGTPMENHLGELWSLFNFLLPGLLGDEKQFRQFYRNPIEKEQNTDRRNALIRKIKPFMLRRTKDMVARELPPKSQILQTCELAQEQRDLYETIRISMLEKVRREIENKGFARSHIVVLDALLKLRQVCCHPQLLKLEAAQKITASAKLESLMDMLPEMLEEGRKILLFSQFVSMLELIEKQLQACKIEYVKLTGQTKDRKTPINDFQNGKKPLFLISLKAGGTGLNLTAADTVIHYDPWWNPAVENQATDRAHRIGQDKPVFVYKLITAGTVEEKILQLQEKKRALAEGIFNPTSQAAGKLTADDIHSLFE
ncbi:MAG: DEAD/DEAH box helicase [Candidatus Schekmanbacteria bacterium]|nr:DEAD/DEAH box helicase [Candidatus Schekmanbacteria bacterium]